MARRNTSLFVSTVKKWGPISMQRLGITAEQAAGIWGNAGHESNGLRQMQEIRPTVSGSRGGAGPIQETGPRRVKYENWLRQHGYTKNGKPDIWNIDAGMEYVIVETLTPPFLPMLRGLRRCRTVQEATKWFCNEDERPGVVALNSRYNWANIAYQAILDGLRTPVRTGPTTSPTSGQEQVVTPSTVPVPTGIWAWIQRIFGKSVLPSTTPPPATARTSLDEHPPGWDPVIADVQRKLSDHGYTEVGSIDGFAGPKLEAAIRNAQRENGLQESGVVDDNFLAFLPKLPVRHQSEARSTATVGDLRDAGNPIVRKSDTVKLGGGLFGILGALGGIQSSGVLDTIQGTLTGVQGATGQASNILSTIEGGLGGIVTTIQWCTQHWWIFAVIAGLFVIYKGVTIAETQVIQFRQAFLTRKS